MARHLAALALNAAAAAHGGARPEPARRPSVTIPSLQGVVMPTLDPDYLYFHQSWDALQQLNAQLMLFGPWFVYPRYAIQELWPPSPHLCGHLNGDALGNEGSVNLSCAEGTVEAVEAALWGQPAGFCGNFTTNKCTIDVSKYVAALCLGKKACSIHASPVTLGPWQANCGPHLGHQQLSVQLKCSVRQTHTYWNTQRLDPQIEAYFKASEGKQTALGWGGHPNWLYQDGFFYNESDYSFVPDDYFDSDFHYEQGRILRDPTGTELGDYYGRSLSHFINGGHTDEAGRYHKGYRYNITIFQSINEPEAEHKCNYTEYTHRYDAIVEGIWRHADPDHRLEFLLGQLSGHREWDWYHFMLNSSNHRPGIPIDWLSYHFYSSTGASLGDSALESLFEQADDFLSEVAEIQTIIAQYTPTSATGKKAKNYIDEIGCFAPVGADTMKPSQTLFWNACGGMYAYLFGQFTVLGIEYAGTSQLMGFPEIKGKDRARLFPSRAAGTDIPTQVPSVTIIDPMEGRPNSRYWVLKLMIDELSPGVVVVNSTFGAVVQPEPAPQPPPPPPLANRNFCGSVRDPSYLLTLSCDEPSATIAAIVFADYGLPSGGCAAPTKDINCSSAELDAVVVENCTGKHACTIDTYWPGIRPHVDPCFGKVKTLLVVAHCSSGFGKATNTTSGGSSAGPPVYMQGYESSGAEADGGTVRKLLVVNRRARPYQLSLPRHATKGGGEATPSGELARVVDQASGEGWYRNETVGTDGVLRLAPFAVAVVYVHA